MNTRILANGCIANNDTRITGLNNNDIIIGPSGAGKTRGYVLPNILQCNESLLVTDTKGSLKKEVGAVLKCEGYTVTEINFSDCFRSTCGYNPLDFIRFDEERGKYSEQDILTIAACLVPVENRHDAFWDLAARMVIEFLIGYVLECLPSEEHTLCSVVALFGEMGTGRLERLFMELNELNPDSFAATRYRLFKSTVRAEKMYASIQGVLAQKLAPLTFDGTASLYTRSNRICFSELGKQKTAVFLVVSDTDRSMDRLVNLFYTQALHTLCRSADSNLEHRLAIPVRLILDDFAANTTIPDFDKIISVIRSREISVSIILQSISQLEASYGHARAMTIINNCDHCLYLGGQDVETARYMSIKANKPINRVLSMPLENAWLFTRGTAPRMVERYDLESHERYSSNIS